MAAVRAFQAVLSVFLSTPMGRKTVMALTGVGAAAFLVVHLLGNLVALEGAPAYDRYASGLHAIPFLIVAEVGLGVLFVTHVTLGIMLFFQNVAVRPQGYDVRASAGAKTLASSTMLYSGLTILAFIVYHLWTIKFRPPQTASEYDRVHTVLHQPWPAVAYAVGICAVGLHLSHGAPSALLTFGLRHHLHDPWVDMFARIAAVAVAIGFASVVAWFFLNGARLA
jgi:succinate dehydrogenase / fumarate reductase, cytochrome b subunit